MNRSEELFIEKSGIARNSSLREIGADSFDKLSIVSQIERRFRIRIPSKRIGEIHTVAQIIDYVDSATAGTTP